MFFIYRNVYNLVVKVEFFKFKKSDIDRIFDIFGVVFC